MTLTLPFFGGNKGESFLEHNVTTPLGSLLIKVGVVLAIGLVLLMYIDRRIIR